MGADCYHVSTELAQEARRRIMVERYKQIELLAYKWEGGSIPDKRLAEAVFGVVNEEVKDGIA